MFICFSCLHNQEVILVFIKNINLIFLGNFLWHRQKSYSSHVVGSRPNLWSLLIFTEASQVYSLARRGTASLTCLMSTYQLAFSISRSRGNVYA